jgi:Uma2 family endonuclease
MPGTATERDVIRLHDTKGKLCELVDGVLVEKVMGFPESRLAIRLAHLIQSFLDEHDLGELAGADGTLRLMPGQVRIPDVSFISRARLTDPSVLEKAIPDLAPDLAVEVLSEGNTPEEMDRKVKEYFFSGCRLVWLVDPRRRSVRVYTAPDQETLLTEVQTLEGGTVLPGFSLPLTRLFTRTAPAAKPKTRRKRT